MPTRRDILRKAGLAGSLVTIPAVAGSIVANRAEAAVCSIPIDDDAELLALGAEFERLYAEWLPILIEEQRLGAVFASWMGAHRCASPEETISVGFAATGLDKVSDASESLCERMDAIIHRAHELPIHTVAGLAVRMRLLRFAVFPGEQFTTPDEDMDWDKLCFIKALRAVDAFLNGGRC